MITIPSAFIQSTIAREGEAGRQWLAQLPDVVDQLCSRWQLVIDGEVRHGYLGLTVPVQRRGEACILKVAWIEEAGQAEAAALAAWQGRGAVQLLAAEPTLGALLLERLDATRSLWTLPVTEAVVVAGQLLRRLAIPAPAGFRSTAVMGQAMATLLPERWGRYGEPMPRPLLERVMALARELAQEEGRLLVNYDLIYEDVLAGAREPWLAIDPKVAVGQPEFGLAQLLWTRLDEIEASGGLAKHFALLVEAAGVDYRRAQAWTLVRCVDYWFWALSAGFTEDPMRCARLTTWLVDDSR
ncbi:MAG: hypothetical protein KF832_31780 [Caldilineaceae bacterium]|nr:hypothetical protein [Caldilineaceae bacterium]